MAKKKQIEIVNETTDSDIDAFGDIDISIMEDSEDNIEQAFDSAMKGIETAKNQKEKALKDKVSKKRQEVEATKKELGIRTPKQSKFPTQSDDFLSKPVSDRAIHVILNQHMSKIYLDGVDIAPRILMGIPAFNKQCKKNAFEHLIRVQEKIREFRGNDPKTAPKWIIISNDSSMLHDRNLISRLEELKDTTHVAAPYGFSQIRASGRWFNLDTSDVYRGCYAQGNMNNIEWGYINGIGYEEVTRRRILIAHGPFIAVRGETFMSIDFKNMSEHMESGYYHYMADISLECHKRGYLIAQIKSMSSQYDDIMKVFSSSDVQVDHAYFTSKWQSILPISIVERKNK